MLKKYQFSGRLVGCQHSQVVTMYTVSAVPVCAFTVGCCGSHSPIPRLPKAALKSLAVSATTAPAQSVVQ